MEVKNSNPHNKSTNGSLQQGKKTDNTKEGKRFSTLILCDCCLRFKTSFGIAYFIQKYIEYVHLR